MNVNPTAQAVLKSIAIALLSLLFLNLISFCIALMLAEDTAVWSYGYKNLVFSINEKPTGIAWRSTESFVLLAIFFTLSFRRIQNARNPKKA